MGAVGSSLAFCFGLCRIAWYNLTKALCNSHEDLPRPEYDLLCLGFEGAGKTTILAHLSGEDVRGITPTEGKRIDEGCASSSLSQPFPYLGFTIKPVVLDGHVFNVKEIGGSAKLRPYWERYYKDMQGLVG